MNPFETIDRLLPILYFCFTAMNLYILMKIYFIRRDKKVLAVLRVSILFSFYLLYTGLEQLLGDILGFYWIAAYLYWFSEITLCFIIVTIPYLLRENLKLPGGVFRINRFIYFISLISTAYIILFAIVTPENFIFFNPGETEFRGNTGYLYSLRDLISILLFTYGAILTGLYYKKSRFNQIQKNLFLGILITFIFSIFTLYENITGQKWFESAIFRFDVGITIASILMLIQTTSSILKQGAVSDRIRKLLKEKQSELLYRSRYMSSTKLLNRDVFLEELKSKVHKGRDSRAYIFIKIINYSQLYEFFGNDTASHILKQISYRLENLLLENGELFHIDTDEFAILLKSTDSEGYIRRYAEIVRSILIQRIPIKDNFYFIDVKIGVILSKSNILEADTILSSAYTTLNNADRENNKILFYDDNLRKKSFEKYNIINSIQSALKGREFYFYYQPIVSSNGRVEVMEALLRWDQPYSVSRVISYAEKSGLMYELGIFTFSLLVEDIQVMRRRGVKQKVFFNISPIQLVNEGFAHFIIGQIEKYNLSRNDIGFELTESMVIADDSNINSNLNVLLDMGFELVLDDFGKGYSSLSYLYKLPVSRIKIDKEFLVSVPENISKCNLIKHIVSMARDFEYKIVVEGVETKEQLDFVKDLGLDYYQGYYFYTPLPLGDIVELDL